MSKKDEALKLALEALEDYVEEYGPHEKDSGVSYAITVIREALAEQPAQQEPVAVHQFRKRGCSDWYDGHPDHTDGGGPYESRTLYTSPSAQQEPVFAIRLLTNQCFALIQERDELQKQVWRYEKNGVTCQTYRHKVDASCSECNVHEVYTSPPAQQQEPVAWVCEGSSSDEKHAIDYWPGDVDDLPIGTKLYTSPPASKPCKVWDAEGYDALCQQLEGWKARASKPWAGLTDEERIACTQSPFSAENYLAIEAKLKEKNT